MIIKGVFQHDELDCGPACLATICKYYHVSISLQKLREYAKTDFNGTSLYGLKIAADKVGFETQVYTGNFDEFLNAVKTKQVNLPLIVHVVKKKIYFIIL